MNLDTRITDTSRVDAAAGLRTLLAGLAVVAVAVMVGAAAAGGHQTLVLVLAGAAVTAAFACVRPDLFGLALVAMLFVPYTWSPTIRSSAEPLIVLFALPAGVVGAVLLILQGRLRLCILDYLVVAIFASALLSEIATGSGADPLGARTLTHYVSVGVLVPYLAFRLIFTAWPQAISRLPSALILTGAGLSLFAIFEELRGTNLFAHSSLNNPHLAPWAIIYPRAGGVRADATMGHPLAFGSFLVVPLVFAFAQRRWWLFSVLAVGEALTLSRGPYIAAIAALLLCGVVTKRMSKLWVLLFVVGIMALFVAPVRNSVTNSFKAGTGEQADAIYRSELWRTSLGSVTLWGKPGEGSELFTGGQYVLRDVTSELALLSGEQGVLGLTIWVGFLAAFGYAIREGRKRSDTLLLLLGVALVGEWVALLSVPLITSFADIFWLTVALMAARLSQLAGPAKTTSLDLPRYPFQREAPDPVLPEAGALTRLEH